ncbi:hypothetical protein DET48_107106 [Vibrio diazotrophicus]|uniref:Uncharacterized protein n=1 Tax=Vibrio diazotrophicus TaxID=685 RepID=A0A329EAJ6_VIBDI|nr:hypothetical protein [Vibrio diazotrophicus]RAS65394.1 hypothetical protein DET48_107106 [Vibrio diazotrophicus]
MAVSSVALTKPKAMQKLPNERVPDLNLSNIVNLALTKIKNPMLGTGFG